VEETYRLVSSESSEHFSSGLSLPVAPARERDLRVRHALIHVAVDIADRFAVANEDDSLRPAPPLPRRASRFEKAEDGLEGAGAD
jgi:hypothetical protein